MHTYVTIRGTSALMASSIPAAATGGLFIVRSSAVYMGVEMARIRDEDGGSGSAGLLDALLNIGEDGETEVLLAGLLGVGSTDDLCACACVSIRLRVDATQLFVWAHTVLDRLLRVEASTRSATPSPATSSRLHSRSLLAGEPLEQHLGVAVDAEILDGLGVLRRAGCVLPCRGLGERRAHGLSESLHGDCVSLSRRLARCGEGYREGGVDRAALNEQQAATAHGRTCTPNLLGSTAGHQDNIPASHSEGLY